MNSPDPERRSLAPRLPLTIGRFTLCKAVGTGGMATVYLSKMQLGGGLDRLVALKTIHQHLAKEQTFVDMFLDEAQIASHITHPNVCAVYDFGATGGHYFLAMEYLVGEPLFDVINQIVAKRSDDLVQTLPYLAARILADACEGLHAAHELKGSDGGSLGVVHRDVSPQNLFVTYEGSVKVVDFGCAKALERVTQTNEGVMKGKVSYAAPEQLREEAVDARADVFALGICLWETLTLRQLFRRDTGIKTAMAVLEEPIPRADVGASWVPQELADIADKALQRDPDLRYQSARALGRALRGFVAKSGVPFESAEVADWMQHLFRDRHEEVLRSIAQVEAMDVGAVNTTSALAAATSNGAPSLAPGGPVGLAQNPTPSGQRERAPALGLVEDGQPAPRSGFARLFLVVVVLALIAGGAYAAFGEQLQNLFSEADVVETDPDTMAPAEPIEDFSVEDLTVEELPVEDPPVEEPLVEDVLADPDPSEESGMRRSPRREANADDDDGADEADEADDAYYGEGSLRMTANGGWALVVHQGRRLGRTPLSVNLPVGPQVLRVYPFGFEPGHEVTIQVEPGTLRRLTIDVDPRDDPANMGSSPSAE